VLVLNALLRLSLFLSSFDIGLIFTQILYGRCERQGGNVSKFAVFRNAFLDIAYSLPCFYGLRTGVSDYHSLAGTPDGQNRGSSRWPALDAVAISVNKRPARQRAQICAGFNRIERS
jgi:hypothetical protein